MAAKEKYTRILWLDLETTGSSEDAEIIELGAVLTDMQFNVVDTYQKVYYNYFPFEALDPIVQKMHTANGLWQESMKSDLKATSPLAEGEILKFLGSDTNHILLAGSGVSHFDRRYIKRDWPRVDKRLTYYSLDIGVVRRFLKVAANIQLPSTKDENHRALGDVMNCIEEAKQYKEILKTYSEGLDGAS